MLSVADGYNSLAGQDIVQIKALADGVFAFAVTLLVLGLNVPAAGVIFTAPDNNPIFTNIPRPWKKSPLFFLHFPANTALTN